MKKIKIRCPYFMLLVLTSVLFGCFYMLGGNLFPNQTKTEAAEKAQNVRSESIWENGAAQGDTAGQEQNVPEQNVPEDSVSGDAGKPDANAEASVQKEHEEIVLDTEEAVQEYLSGTLFIGDSRTATLQEYAGWDRAHFYVKYGLTIWDVLDEKLVEYGGEKITVDEALQKRKFKRIYIMLGINELGRGTAETFAEQFGAVVGRIQELQPDAIIVVEAIMHVTKEKDEEKTYINNTEINARNDELKKMAERLGVYWLDVNQATDDEETQCLDSQYSFDGVHLKVKYLDVWKNFILEHPF